MIDPKELRIGNLVYHNHEKGRFEVQWELAHFHWLEAAGGEEEYEPIPITPEWLERLGVVKDFWGERKISLDGQLRIYINNNGVFIVAGEIDEAFPHIKHVHQLQNLYFALTGKELTVKQPATT